MSCADPPGGTITPVIPISNSSDCATANNSVLPVPGGPASKTERFGRSPAWISASRSMIGEMQATLTASCNSALKTTCCGRGGNVDVLVVAGDDLPAVDRTLSVSRMNAKNPLTVWQTPKLELHRAGASIRNPRHLPSRPGIVIQSPGMVSCCILPSAL
jgi:hypothetical protein